MTKTEVLLSEAVSVLRDDETYPATVRKAMIDVLNAGLCWFDDAEDYELPSGHISTRDRQYKIAPEGRATIALAEAIIAEASA